MKLRDLVPPILRRSAAAQPHDPMKLPPWLGGHGAFGFGGFATIGHGGGFTNEGAEIDEYTAMTATAVWACVQVIAGALGTLPIHVRRIDGNAIVGDHPAAIVLRRPNDMMTRSDTLEALSVNLLTTGNGYLFVDRDPLTFDPRGLLPLRSLNTRPQVRGGRLRYHVKVNGKQRTIGAERVVHVRGMSRDGLIGLSPLRCGYRAVGLALALDSFAETFFTNGANIGNVVELPPMRAEQLEEFKRLWRDEYEGLQNSHKTAAAPGLKVHKAGYSPKESQADEQRLTQLREIARLYQVPPHKIGDLEKTTVGNSEEQARQFAEQTLRRWVVKIEQALEQTLLREDERGTLKIRINLDASIRGSLKDRIDAVSSATGGAPVMTPNEARDHLDLQPLPGGDDLLQNLNQGKAAGDAQGQRAALLRGVVQRMATKENNALTRAAKKSADAAELRAWGAQFYDAHELVLRRALDGAGVEGEAIADYCAQRRAALEGLEGPEAAESSPEIRSICAKTADVLSAAVLAPAPALGAESGPETHEDTPPSRRSA